MSETSQKKWSKSSIADFLINNAIYVVLLLLVIIIICMDSSFLSVTNFRFIITQASTRVILALGVAGLLVLAGTDLSVGRMVGLSAVISASLLQTPEYARRIFPDMAQLPVFVPILLAIFFTALASTISGYVIAKFKVTAFIVTLSMQLILYGALSLYYDYTGGSPIANLDERFKYFAQGSLSLGFIEVPFLVIYAAITVGLVWFIWNKTRLGKNMFAVGGNEEAATVSGVNVIRTIVLVSMLAGVLYGCTRSCKNRKRNQ
ncbi:MAG: beta-methylgalactoside transporter [Niameybacter sp.]